mgnify:CR=1 FL=1
MGIAMYHVHQSASLHNLKYNIFYYNLAIKSSSYKQNSYHTPYQMMYSHINFVAFASELLAYEDQKEFANNNINH